MALMSKPKTSLFEFGPFQLDTVRRLLLRDEAVVALPPKAFDTLLTLVENCDRVLEKSELMTAVWPDSFVEEANLTQTVSILRKALGERAGEHRYIVTVPGRGYRFVASVGQPIEQVADLILERHVISQIVAEYEESTSNGEGAEVEFNPNQQSLDPSNQQPTASRKLLVNPLSLRRRKPAGWTGTLVIGVAVLALAAIAVLAYRYLAGSTESHASPIRSIAVLPLKNLTGDPTQDYFSDGMTQSLIMALSKIEDFKVISYGSVSGFKGQDADPREAGKRLGVAAVLEGSVRKSNHSVRVAVRLVSVEDGQVLWARDTHERALGDIFALQDEIAQTVVEGLRLKLGHKGEQQLAKRYTENVEAYQAYMRGRFFWNKRNGEGFGKAIAHFQQAIDMDPNYALAYAGLADAYILKRIYALLQPGETLQQMEAKAKAAAEKALAIDDTLAEAHTSLGLIKATIENDEADIEREYKQAIALNPNYATAHHWYALHLNDVHRFDEAIAEISRAREIDPLSLVINSDVGIIFSSARRYDQAIEYFKKAIEMDANFPDAHSMLGWTYVRKGMYPEAIAEFEKARELFGSPTSQLDGLIYAYGLSGNRGEALKVLDKLKRLSKQHHTQLPWENWLNIHIGLGEHDKAFEVLEKAHQEGSNVKRALDTPYLDPLRSDSRFADLRRRVGLTH
jgi:TolB-like protein/DNA-binding winged helix-turn-helix (wHTH) protein/Tfp pilus assembly protein PilF